MSERDEERRGAQSEIAELRRRLAEAEARAAESERTAARYRALVDALPDAVTVTDMTGRITEVSAQVTRLYGGPREDLLGLEALKLIHPDDRARAAANLERTLRDGVVRELPYRLRRADGSWYDAELSAALIRGPDGEPSGFIASVRDVTERRRMEAELQKADRLESLGILAGGIAHDFNNILAIIAGNISLAAKLVPPNSELAAILEDVDKAVLQGRRLTQQLVTFGKGGAPLKRRLSLGPLIRDAASLVLRGSKAIGRLQLPDDLWEVDADENQFAQVFQNLVLNAVQSMPEGGIVEIEAENVEVSGNRPPLVPGRYVRVSVRDGGAGIPPAERSRIFDPFFTTKPGGSGLGLAVVYSIVRRHDGHVDVESEVGRGSVFHVWVPARGNASSE